MLESDILSLFKVKTSFNFDFFPFFFCYLVTYHHHHPFICNPSQKKWTESTEKDRVKIKKRKEKQKETKEIKTRFDNYKKVTKRNDQRWEDFWHLVVKSLIRFSITPAGFTE